jgi:hypothetical protein
MIGFFVANVAELLLVVPYYIYMVIDKVLDEMVIDKLLRDK